MKRLLSMPARCCALLSAAALAAVLAGCGGGGSDTAAVATTTPVPGATAAPTVQIGVSPSQVTAGQTATLAWTSASATGCAASGAWSGAQPTAGSVTVTTAAIGSPTYALDCTGPGGTGSGAATLSVVAPVARNVLAVTVDRGPGGDSFNMPFVSVTVCSPGTTTCRTVDHVLVDTGSDGLRLMASALDSAFELPVVANASNTALGECAQFASGFAWGSVRRADIWLGGESATAVPVQIVSDPAAAYATIPTACRNTGSNLGSPAALGANGILGVSQFVQDCGAACVSSAAPGLYYACTAAGCTATALPLESQVANPVASFPADNNGVAIALPPVPPGGLTGLVGTLTFGIGTQPNNQMESATVYATDAVGNFSTVYKGATYSSSFIDSGSNGIFFDDPTIPLCSGFYCPPAPLTLNAVNASPNGATGTVTFTIENLQPLSRGVTALNAGGSIGLRRTFDWGLPFFFGRTVFVGIRDADTPKGKGPYWAY